MTTRPFVERLIPIELVYAVVYHGVADRTVKDHRETLERLRQAMDAELEGLPRAKRESATRHSRRAADEILRPFVEKQESCAVFGLAIYYVLNYLIRNSLYDLQIGGPFDQAMDAVLNPDGTITEVANISRLDDKCQKMARRIIRNLNDMGYYVEGLQS